MASQRTVSNGFHPEDRPSGDTLKLARDEKKEVSVSVEETGADTPSFPEGGTQAWLTLFGAFLFQYVTFGYINAFGVYQDFYIRSFLTDYTPSAIGWIGGTQIFLNFSSGVFVGRAFDRGYFYYLMAAGAFVHGLSLFMLSLSHQNSFYQVFLTNGVLLGLSGGLCYIPALGITSHYFHKKRPLAMGIASAGSALGSVLHPIMLNKLINGHIGFHNGVRISAALNVALLLIGLSVMRTRLPPKPVQTFPVLKWFKDPAFCASVASAWFIFLGLFYPVFYIQLLAVMRGVDRKFAFYALPILNAASFFGRIIPPMFAPKLGVFNVWVFCAISSGIVVLFMVLVRDVTGTVLVAIFYGFTSGGGIALVPSTVAVIANDVSELGTRIGILFVFAGLLGLFATPISGALLTKDYHWLNAGLFSGISLIIAGLCNVVARHYVAQRKGSHRV
ncbi:unnamed protein product [Cyclocybe aegerita]|uniref:Uncharacterized protein n=1 Tax=Cyclocybe aegerita TaxID=1973307 RepID=A0A8S0X076_CYCAE|nr:unnamed protein product [Cyclocybe aegerita]